MHGIGKSSMWTAAGFAFVSGLLLLQPTQASAQFNIEGLIRGAIQQQGCCYGGGAATIIIGRARVRTAPSRVHKDDDSAPVDKSKEKDATQVESANNNGPGGRQQPAGPAQSPSRSVESDASTKQTSSRGNDDQPAFSPSR